MFQKLCGRHTKQVQLDELEHFATKEQAVVCSWKKNKEKWNPKTTIKTLFYLLPPTSSVPRDVKALQPEGQSGAGASNRHPEAQHNLGVSAGLSGLSNEQHRQGTNNGKPPLTKCCVLKKTACGRSSAQLAAEALPRGRTQLGGGSMSKRDTAHCRLSSCYPVSTMCEHLPLCGGRVRRVAFKEQQPIGVWGRLSVIITVSDLNCFLNHSS